jgi:very-short-patch-repair endonuclease
MESASRIQRKPIAAGGTSSRQKTHGFTRSGMVECAEHACEKERARRINPAHTLFEAHLAELGLYYVVEARFHFSRKWRFDFLLDERVAVEIEGAIWSRGRHTRGKGFQADLDKYNAATMAGYRVLRFSTDDVLKGRAKAFLKEWLCGDIKIK